MEGMHVVGRTGTSCNLELGHKKPRLGARLGAALVDTAEGKLSGGISSLEGRDNVCMMYCHAMAYLLDVQERTSDEPSEHSCGGFDNVSGEYLTNACKNHRRAEIRTTSNVRSPGVSASVHFA